VSPLNTVLNCQVFLHLSTINGRDTLRAADMLTPGDG